MKSNAIIFLVAAIILAPALSAAGDVIIVGNQSIKDSVMSKKDIVKIFLGKRNAWDDGPKIVVVLQKDPAIHNTFLKQYVSKSRSQFNAAWKRLIFSGKRSSPKILDGDLEVIEFISETKGAIGYVSSDKNLDHVNKIRVK